MTLQGPSDLKQLRATSGAPHAGASDELSAWVIATAPRALAYAASLLRDRERAEDVVQDCYCRLLAKAEIYDLPADGLKLLLTSISNTCINLGSRRRVTLSLWSKHGRPLDLDDPAARDPAAGLLEDELAEAIGRALALLPIRQRAAVELKSRGHSLHEVAEILGISPSNAGVLIHRARSSMEATLAPYLEGRGA